MFGVELNPPDFLSKYLLVVEINIDTQFTKKRRMMFKELNPLIKREDNKVYTNDFIGVLWMVFNRKLS